METTTTVAPTPDEIRARRKAAGLTLTQLAGLAECSLTFLGNLERGYVPRRSPTLERVDAVLTESTNVNGAPPKDAVDQNSAEQGPNYEQE